MLVIHFVSNNPYKIYVDNFVENATPSTNVWEADLPNSITAVDSIH